MRLLNFGLLVATLLMLGWSTTSRAEMCDASGSCISLFESAGGILLRVKSDGLEKGLVGMEIDLPAEDIPIIVDVFEGAGFSCTGSLSPPAAPATHGTTSFTCSYQNTNGDIWRVTVTITWVFNPNNGKWEIADLEAKAKLVRVARIIR